MVFAVRPDVLHWVQLRRVGRQSVPNQQDVAINVAKQVFEKFDNLLGFDGLFEELKVKVPEGDTGDHRSLAGCFSITMRLLNKIAHFMASVLSQKFVEKQADPVHTEAWPLDAPRNH